MSNSYTIQRTSTPPKLDGKADSPVWQRAAKSPRFVDMVTGGPAILGTTAAALWDDEALYVAFWVEEPYPSAKLTERDSLIFQENDVEVFIDTGNAYYEFEMNALNTVYEVLFVWQDAYEKVDQTQFDLRKAIAFGGNFDRTETHFWRGTHPRGLRWAYPSYDLPELTSATHIDGELNNPNIVSKGWTAEIKFPWAGMRTWAGNKSLPPKDGDEWRIFFGRFQKLLLGDKTVGAAWSWDVVGSSDNHLPEKFTPVKFSNKMI
jgi:Carbohydrate family 9 binding domain-like